MFYIGNAIKHNDKPKIEISVECNDKNKFWEFSINDNGPGIDTRYHEKIFVIFQTLKARDEFESTGIGLAIVKKIIEDVGGNIWVESSPGNGASFKLKIKKNSIDPALITGINTNLSQLIM